MNIEQHTTTSLRPSMTGYYLLIDSNGNIFQQNAGVNSQVGVTMTRFNETEKLALQAIDKAETYEKQLVEAGLIVKPLTAEEQVKVLTEQVQDLTGAVQALLAMQTPQQTPPSDLTFIPVEKSEEPAPTETTSPAKPPVHNHPQKQNPLKK